MNKEDAVMLFTNETDGNPKNQDKQIENAQNFKVKVQLHNHALQRLTGINILAGSQSSVKEISVDNNP
jgi:hypothetical protein